MYRDQIESAKLIIGSKVTGISVLKDYEVSLLLDGGWQARLWLDADCCSNSFFTDMTQFDELVGATIVEFEERHGKSREDLKEDNLRDECPSWHFLVIKTDKGHVTIDWRNDSNGYYDGILNLNLLKPD